MEIRAAYADWMAEGVGVGPWLGAGRQVVPSRPEAPWMSGAKQGERHSGWDEPGWTAMEGREMAVRIDRVLVVVWERGALPWVVEMPRRCRRGVRAETRMAKASWSGQ